MISFLAILKDSFREAVDGFVIYAMLVMSAIIILVAASLSFTPAPAPDAFNKIVVGFQMVFPEKGRNNFAHSNVEYRATEVTPVGGGYTLKLTAKGNPTGGMITDDKGTRPVLEQGDSFRQTVVTWAKNTKRTDFKVDNAPARKQQETPDPEIGFQRASVEEQRAVTDALMGEFIKYQFSEQAGMDATVTRVKGGVEEPTYLFDVTTTGGSAVQGWPHITKIFFGAVTLDDDSTLGGTLWLIEDLIINRFGGTMVLLVAMIITSFFIPNMLRKGSVDLLISKPIGRTQLLLYKYIGGMTFVFILSVFTIGGIWFVLALRSGYWNPSFLMAIPILTFTFAIFYAVSTLVAVFTRNAIAAMLLAVGFAFFMFIFGQIKSSYDDRRAARPDVERSAWIGWLVDGAHDVLPRTRELEVMTRKYISDGTLPPAVKRLAVQAPKDPSPWIVTVGVTLLDIGAMLGLSCWWFSRRDF